MRESIFRGKRLDNGEWVLGDLLRGSAQFNPGQAYICPELYAGHMDSGSLLFGGFVEVDLETVGQYTGLKDIVGKMIFEGDIVKVPDDYDEFGMAAGEIYAVYFAFGGFRLKPKYNKNARGFWLEDNETVEVIGNIYDNPELLEKQF